MNEQTTPRRPERITGTHLVTWKSRTRFGLQYTNLVAVDSAHARKILAKIQGAELASIVKVEERDAC